MHILISIRISWTWFTWTKYIKSIIITILIFINQTTSLIVCWWQRQNVLVTRLLCWWHVDHQHLEVVTNVMPVTPTDPKQHHRYVTNKSHLVTKIIVPHTVWAISYGPYGIWSPVLCFNPSIESNFSFLLST